MKSVLWMGMLWGILAGAAVAQPSLLDQGRDAEAAENYQRAVELYRKALESDPHDPEPAQALAELYSANDLHELARPAWQEVVRRNPGDSQAWLWLAQSWSYLDQNRESVKTLEEAQQRLPADPEIVQSLAWMLFKIEDFRRGIDLINTFSAVHGTDRSLEMTLGTLYSSLYDYDLSRVHYLKSIALAAGPGAGEKNFRSIAWYNLSILEKAFHQFDLADQAIQKSLEEEDRPAGTLAWGELFQNRRDFAQARRLYEKAAAVDETPLARFDLARLLQQFGLLDEAETQLAQVEAHEDDTWIYNYGVTKDKMRRDIHELRALLHQARYRALDFSPRSNPWEWLVWLGAKIQQGWSWWYHEQTWKALLVRLSESSMAVSNSPDAWVGLTLANQDRPDLALKYLALIRNHELPKNPRAAASYEIEEGIIRRSAPVLEKALTRIQIPWENEDRERALATLAEIRRDEGRIAEQRRILGQWFALNPGGLPVRGWGLPVRTAVFGDPQAVKEWKDSLEAYRTLTGWDAGSEDRAGVAWSLDLRTEGQDAVWTLRNPEGITTNSGRVRAESGRGMQAIADLFQAVHTPPR